MRKLLVALFAALLMAGCGEDSKKPGGDSPETSQSSTDTIDLDDNETRNRIAPEAIDDKTLDSRWVEISTTRKERLKYAPNKQTPYTGWSKWMHYNGQLSGLSQWKDGKRDGLEVSWYGNGQKNFEATYKDSKIVTAVAWKFNGERCPVTNVVNGNGVVVKYYRYGVLARNAYKDGFID